MEDDSMFVDDTHTESAASKLQPLSASYLTTYSTFAQSIAFQKNFELSVPDNCATDIEAVQCFIQQFSGRSVVREDICPDVI